MTESNDTYSYKKPAGYREIECRQRQRDLDLPRVREGVQQGAYNIYNTDLALIHTQLAVGDIKW